MGNYKKVSERIEELKIDNPKTVQELKWVNIISAGKKEIDYLRKNYRFDLLHLKVAAASVSFQRPMIYRGSSYLCLVLHFPVLKNGKIVAGEVDFFIGHGFLISVHNGGLKALNNLFNLGKKSPDSLLSYSVESSAVLLYEILGHLTDETYRLLDDNSVKINEIEELIFDRQQKEAVMEILSLRRNIINVRRIVQNHKNIFQQLMTMDSTLVEKSAIKKYYNNLIEQAKRIWEMLDNQREIVEVLYNTNESLLNNRMTDIMKTLTIFSVIVFPLTLLAAVFGMNVPSMPLVSLPYGFWWIVVVMLFGVAGMLIFFKIKKWL